MESNVGTPVAHQPFDFQDLLQLIELMKSTSQFSEFKLRTGGIELELRRGPAGTGSAVSAGASPVAAPAPAGSPAPAPAPAPAPTPVHAQATASALETRSQPGGRAAAEGIDVAKAPMVGTVYLAPEPGAQPFVVLGQAVESGTQLCIVEVMKLMNSVVAGCTGVVSEILVGDGEAVEFGQALFVITPA